MKKINTLKAWRIANGFTQKEMANKLDVAEYTYIRYENFRKKTLCFNFADKIIKITNGHITPSHLAGYCDKEINLLKKNNKCQDKSDKSDKLLNFYANKRYEKLVNEFN